MAGNDDASLSKSTNKVNAWTEWAKLNECVVGRADGGCYPPMEPTWQTTFRQNPELAELIPFPVGPKLKQVVAKANVQLNNMVELLEGEGVVVHRTLSQDFNKPIKTPDFEIQTAFCNTCPRDTVITLGNVILEATMSRRCRYFEFLGTRHVTRHLFKNDKNMLWKCAPKPSMADSMYDQTFWSQQAARKEERMQKSIFRYPLTDAEVAFDAADMMKFGSDVVIQHSAVTNKPGIEWLRRELKDHINFKVLHSPMESTPIHIDATLIPLRPPTTGSRGIIMYCPSPNRVLPPAELDQFRKSGFDLIPAPHPCVDNMEMPMMCEWGHWLSMNLFQISPTKVIIEEQEKTMAAFLEDLGIEPLTIAYTDVFEFGGSLHCSTWDINRDDEKKSYLPGDNYDLPEHSNPYPNGY